MLSMRFIEIKLIISSGTTYLTDGPAGYADGLQVMYNWSQAHMFRMGKQGVGARSLITCILLPQPMVPYIKLAEDMGKERLMLTQHSFEATNLARMMIGANSRKSVKSSSERLPFVEWRYLTDQSMIVSLMLSPLASGRS